MQSISDARRELDRIRDLRNHAFTDSRRLLGEIAGGSNRSYPLSPTSMNEVGMRGSILPPYSNSSPIRSFPYTGNSSFAGHSEQHDHISMGSLSSPPRHVPYVNIPAGNRTTSSGFDPPGPPPSFGPGAAASVITSFRQLQGKARVAEQERADALRQREDLRRQIEANQRTQSFWKSQSELQSNESFQNMRAATDQMIAAKRDLELQLMASQDMSISTQRSNAHERALIVNLETDVSEIQAKVHVTKAANRVLEHELAATEGRCERVAGTVESSPSARLKQIHRMEESLRKYEEEIEAAERSTSLTKLRVDALQRYMEMVLNINGDLSQRIMDTANTREHIRELAEKLTPPRYAWPKELPYDSILNAISDAATDRSVNINHAAVAAAAESVIRNSPPAAAVVRLLVDDATGTALGAGGGRDWGRVGYGHTAAALAALRERDETRHSPHHQDNDHRSNSTQNNDVNNDDNNNDNNHHDHHPNSRGNGGSGSGDEAHEHGEELKGGGGGGGGAGTRATSSGGGYSGFEGGVWFGKEPFPNAQSKHHHSTYDNYSSNSHLHGGGDGGGGGVSAAILSEGDNYDGYALLQGLAQPSRQGPENVAWNLAALEPMHGHQHHQQQYHHNHLSNGRNNQSDTVVAALQASASMAMHNSALALQASERQDKYDLDAAYRRIALENMVLHGNAQGNSPSRASASRQRLGPGRRVQTGIRPSSAPSSSTLSSHISGKHGTASSYSGPSRSSRSASYGAAVGASISRSKDAYIQALNALANTSAAQAISPSHYSYDCDTKGNLKTSRTSPPRHSTSQEQAISRFAARAMGARSGASTGKGFVPAGNTKNSFNVVAKGSKVARATTHFTAAVAARVKAHNRNAIDDRLLEPLVDPYRYY